MHRTLVMGIINVTPDSFSDGGAYIDSLQATRHALRLIEEGADILDIGGESTRPGYQVVPWEEEWRRLEPVLREICLNSDCTVSVDTTKVQIAAKAIELGVTIINDVSGGTADAEMLPVVADAGCTYVWMHNRARPALIDAFDVLLTETEVGVTRCLEQGISPDRLWIDPGIGFGKTYEQNLEVISRIGAYCQLEYPVLLGTSRKSVIGRTLENLPPDRLFGSLATVSVGVWQGVSCVRVHDVRETVQVCRMVEAIRDVGRVSQERR